MSYSNYIDGAYQATLASPDEEKQMECHRAGCSAPIDDTTPCDSCGAHFCGTHLYGGYCVACFDLDAAAEELERQEAA